MNSPADIESPRDHPAARHWTELGNPGEPVALEVLQDESTRAVYRLGIAAASRARKSQASGVAGGAGGTTFVIAKRGPRGDIVKEASFYRELLPRLGIPALHSFGVVDDEQQASAWLYLDDAGDRRYDPGDRRHRELAGTWLASLHAASGEAPRPPGLDDRGPAHFLVLLETALQTLDARHDIPALDAVDRAALDAIGVFCASLVDNWGKIESFCAAMPATLVHGDIKEDNLRIGGPPEAPRLLVFDWHEGGWGPPALDLAKFLGYRVAPDFRAYLRGWSANWPGHDIGEIRRLGYVGEIFRWSASVRWHLDDFRYGNIERASARMRVYRDWMREIERAAPWRENPALRSTNWQPLRKTWV